MSKKRIYASRIFEAPPIVINFYNNIIKAKMNKYERYELMKDICSKIRKSNLGTFENNYITISKDKKDIIYVIMFPLEVNYNKYGRLYPHVDEKGKVYIEIEE